MRGSWAWTLENSSWNMSAQFVSREWIDGGSKAGWADGSWNEAEELGAEIPAGHPGNHCLSRLHLYRCLGELLWNISSTIIHGLMHCAAYFYFTLSFPFLQFLPRFTVEGIMDTLRSNYPWRISSPISTLVMLSLDHVRKKMHNCPLLQVNMNISVKILYLLL